MMTDKSAPQTFDEAVAALNAGAARKAAGFARSALALNADDAACWSLLAAAELRDGAIAAACEAYQNLCALRPDDIDAWLGLAEAALRLPDAPRAMTALRRARALSPDDPRLVYFAMPAAYQLGDQAEIEAGKRALAQAERALRLRIATYWALRLQAFGRYREALALYTPVLDGIEADVQAYHLWAQLALSAHDVDGAAKAIDAAQKRAPGDAQTLALRARLNVFIGRLEAAREDARAALDIDPALARAYELLAEIDPRAIDGAMLDHIHRLTENVAQPAPSRTAAATAGARAYEARGVYDEAFALFERANAVTREDDERCGVVFDADELAARLASVTRDYPAALFTKSPACPARGAGLVFIIGLPRSGSTLLDQILAAHSQVVSIGESQAMARVHAEFEERLRNKGGAVGEMIDAYAAEYAEAYEAAVGMAQADGKTIVDKQLFNFWRTGFIARIFPAAKLIVARRDPMENCLSIYRANFGERFEFKTDLRALGAYYRAFDALAAHWSAVLPAPPFEIVHEKLLEAPEDVVVQLQEYCGLEYEPLLERMENADRAVFTMSAAQVRGGIKRKSAARWKHYEAQLAPLREALGDAVRD